MTKYNRTTGRVFAENANPNGNNPEIGVFGSAQLGTYQGSNDIDEISDNEAWGTGWSAGVVSNLNYPPLPEFNGILKYITQQIAYILQAGVPEWDTNTIYYNNYYCSHNGKLWRSNTDDNIGNEPGQSPSWYDATTQLPIASNDNLGAIRTDGVTTQTTVEGVLSVIPSAALAFPIGDPIITFSDTLNDNEIWLEGALLSEETYPLLFSKYNYRFNKPSDSYEVNQDLIVGEPTINDNLMYTPTAQTAYLNYDRVVNDTANPFEFIIGFTAPRTNKNYCSLIGARTRQNLGFALGINAAGYIFLGISSNGTSYNIANYIQANKQPAALTRYKKYYVKLTYSGGETGDYDVYLRQEGTEEWTNIYNLAARAKIFSDYELSLGVDFINANYFLANEGAIDLVSISTKENETTTNYLTFDPKGMFRVPDCRDRAFWGAADFGYIEAGLPNITGVAGVNKVSCSGAFYGSGSGLDLSPTGTYSGSRNINLDAGWQNPIYGNSDTVQPPAIKVRVKTRYQ